MLFTKLKNDITSIYLVVIEIGNYSGSRYACWHFSVIIKYLFNHTDILGYVKHNWGNENIFEENCWASIFVFSHIEG